MKFKFDECLDVRLATLFSDAGHDIQTVYQEKLSGAPDERIYSVCLQEERILLTQDMDFSNPKSIQQEKISVVADKLK